MQGTSSWLWRFNPLLLRLLGQISFSLLCLHSSWGSALDLAPPLRVGHLRVSVPCPDRARLKEQLIRGLWLTHAGREGWVRNAGRAWLSGCNSLRRAVCSPGEVVPGSRDPVSGGLHRLRERRCGWWPVLAHRLLGGCSSNLSVSCPPLVSTLVAVVHACLWSSFRRCSESPLLAHPETMVSCLLGRSRLFPGLPPR